MNIIEFLEARIADEEVDAARDLADMQRSDVGIQFDCDTQKRFTPARVLAECAAKRAIIKDWEDPNGDGVWEGYDYGCALTTDRAARALAAIYSDHPDYQQEWAL